MNTRNPVTKDDFQDEINIIAVKLDYVRARITTARVANNYDECLKWERQEREFLREKQLFQEKLDN